VRSWRSRWRAVAVCRAASCPIAIIPQCVLAIIPQCVLARHGRLLAIATSARAVAVWTATRMALALFAPQPNEGS